METEMASSQQYTLTRGNVHAAAKSLDDTSRPSGGDNTPITQSRKRMVPSPTDLVSNKPRKGFKKRYRNVSFKPLEETTRFRGFRSSFKNWQGTWCKKKLNIGERHWILRIRAGLSQNEAAKQLEISRSAYQQLESNNEDIKTLKITDFEWCRIMRRRIGWTQYEVASQMGVTRIWVNRMETGQENCDQLLWFWEQ